MRPETKVYFQDLYSISFVRRLTAMIQNLDKTYED